jgi:hypothetical protein
MIVEMTVDWTPTVAAGRSSFLLPPPPFVFLLPRVRLSLPSQRQLPLLLHPLSHGIIRLLPSTSGIPTLLPLLLLLLPSLTLVHQLFLLLL